MMEEEEFRYRGKDTMKILLLAKTQQENYIRAVEACGAQAEVKYLPDENIHYDGMIFCGGSDIHPKYYGEEINGSVEIDEERDRTEIALMKKFMQTGKPILGICRGMQLLNVVLGGTLIQDIPQVKEHRREGTIELTHEVIAKKGSLFEETYGERFCVNSYHHQALDQLGEGVLVTLRSADDRVIEGCEHATKPYFGVQWHPERMCLDLEREDTINGIKIFEKFIKMCEKFEA